MPICSVITCKNDSRVVSVGKAGVSYYKFPHDGIIRAKWIEATGKVNWVPARTSTICSKHFDEICFMIKAKGKKCLCDTAIPTLNVLSSRAQMEQLKDAGEAVKKQVADVLKQQGIVQAPAIGDIGMKDKLENLDDKSQNSAEKIKKLKGMLRWTRNRINVQKLKIKRLKMQNMRLNEKCGKADLIFKVLEQKFRMPVEQIVKLYINPSQVGRGLRLLT